MTDSAKAVWQLLNDPSRLGGAVEHFPATAGTVGLLLIVVLLLCAGRSSALRWAAILVFSLGAVAAAMQRPTLADDQPVWLAHVDWLCLALPAGLLLLSCVPAAAVRLPAMVLALMLATASSGVVGYGMAQLDARATLPSLDQPDHPAPSTEQPQIPPAAPDDPDAPGPRPSIFDFGRD